MLHTINEKRVHTINPNASHTGCVAYWMSRDQRISDNWGLLYAQNIALEYKLPLIVVFCLISNFLGATFRQYSFMLKGLAKIELDLKKNNIPFVLLQGNPGVEIPKFVLQYNISTLVADFNPLKIVREWQQKVYQKTKSAFHVVDSHNIVPCKIASPKQEFGAYTLRPKLIKLLPDFLDDFPVPCKHPFDSQIKSAQTNWNELLKSLRIDAKVSEANWLESGEDEAREVLKRFLSNKLNEYSKNRNNPTLDSQSNLSPYIHFGQISPQRVTLETLKQIRKPIETVLNLMNTGPEHEKPSAVSFLEELIVRRELSDNFTFYNSYYDSFDGFPDWAKLSLNEHRNDKREFLYTVNQFENAETHDNLWNAAQKQMLITGKMHGFMRMYWAKKILEWSPSPDEAMATAIYLNDKYEMDGRDPNGYAGIAWSIGGVHDRAWFDRPVFGKIRYMNYNGCMKKFDVKNYIKQIEEMK